MKDIIDELPGIVLPVSEAALRLDTMWQADSGGAPSEFRASQMNVVLHFGLEVDGAEAMECFTALIQFAQRYPCRIIVLCPSRSSRDSAMQAKLFSQCYIGDSHREMCCCEALILGYHPDDWGFLANQVSIWIESDLPLYHWFHRVPPEQIRLYSKGLLKGVRGCIYDSSIEPDEFRAMAWTDSVRVGDLAMARLLPVRQALGQYLSGYSIELLCRGLRRVNIRHAESHRGEAAGLLAWIKDCLSDCHKCQDASPSSSAKKKCPALEAEYDLGQCEAADCLLSVDFLYQDHRYFRWRMLKGCHLARIEADLGKEDERLTTRIRELSPVQMIAEALLF